MRARLIVAVGVVAVTLLLGSGCGRTIAGTPQPAAGTPDGTGGTGSWPAVTSACSLLSDTDVGNALDADGIRSTERAPRTIRGKTEYGCTYTNGPFRLVLSVGEAPMTPAKLVLFYQKSKRTFCSTPRDYTNIAGAGTKGVYCLDKSNPRLARFLASSYNGRAAALIEIDVAASAGSQSQLKALALMVLRKFPSHS